jgi:NOL1/NOP2/fmu family ribosome biogenesis protein
VKGDVLRYLQERFGLDPALFEGHSFYLAPKGRVYLGPSQVPPSLRIVSPGILIARADSGIKPSTNLFQLFGRHATRNVLSVDKEQAKAFANGADLVIPETAETGAGVTTDGYVLVRYSDYNLGCALLKKGALKNMVPKAKRLELKLI